MAHGSVAGIEILVVHNVAFMLLGGPGRLEPPCVVSRRHWEGCETMPPEHLLFSCSTTGAAAVANSASNKWPVALFTARHAGLASMLCANHVPGMSLARVQGNFLMQAWLGGITRSTLLVSALYQ